MDGPMTWPCEFPDVARRAQITPIAAAFYRRMSDHPDFPESLRLLYEKERYSLMDIGTMFGVSSESVRQWVNQHNVTRRDRKAGVVDVRVWDDTLHRFIPAPRKAVTEARRVARVAARRVRLRCALDERRAQFIAAARKVHARHGGPVFALDVWRELGRPPVPVRHVAPHLVRFLSSSADKWTLARGFREAGVPCATTGMKRPKGKVAS